MLMNTLNDTILKISMRKRVKWKKGMYRLHNMIVNQRQNLSSFDLLMLLIVDPLLLDSAEEEFDSCGFVLEGDDWHLFLG